MRSVAHEFSHDIKYRPTHDNGGQAQDKPLPGPSQTPEVNGETQDKPLFRAQAGRSPDYRLQVSLHLLCSDAAVLACRVRHEPSKLTEKRRTSHCFLAQVGRSHATVLQKRFHIVCSDDALLPGPGCEVQGRPSMRVGLAARIYALVRDVVPDAPQAHCTRRPEQSILTL